MIYQNVRGLNTKTNIFLRNVIISQPDIILLTETWLKDNVLDNELFPSNYLVYRRGRNSESSGKNRGGGVAIAVSNIFSSKRITDLETDNEDLWVEVSGGKQKILFCSVYFPPKSPVAKYTQFFDRIGNSEYLESFSNIVICGDFNMSNYFNDLNTELGINTKEFLDQTQLSQRNRIQNKFGNILDYVFTNLSEQNFIVSKSLEPLVKEDVYHPALSFSLSNNLKYRNRDFVQSDEAIDNSSNINTKNLLKEEIRYNFKKCDFLSLYLKLRDAEWNLACPSTNNSCNDVDALVSIFYKQLHAIINECAPTFKPNSKPNKIRFSPPWFTSEIKELLRKQKNYRSKSKTVDKCYYKKKIEDNKSKLNVLLKSAFANYVTGIENSLQIDPKVFWNFLNPHNNGNKIPDNMTFEGASVDKKDVSECFATFFNSIFEDDSSNLPLDVEDDPPELDWSNDTLVIDDISQEEVMQAINDLKNKTSTGPDFIPTYIIKGCKDGLSRPLTLIFNACLKLKTFPSKWKITKVIPIFKKGNKNEVTNYRPVALSSAFVKVFESVIHKKILHHVKPYLSECQFGFLPKRSTVANLLNLTEDISSSLDNNRQTDVLYTDFSKAFDKVNHSLLLRKLKKFGLHSSLIQFLTSYLVGRLQYVFANSTLSETYTVKSGVPQGSILGPLLFLIFINDIGRGIIYCKILLFADDLKIYREIKSLDDLIKLQEDINNLYKWSVENKLPFNISKCSIVTYSRAKAPIHFEYKMGNLTINRVSQILDLGILFKSDLNFNEHIFNICSKASRNLGLIKRSCKSFKNVKTMKTVFNALVRSKLEYATAVWTPYCSTYSDMIERIQARFYRHLLFKVSRVNSSRAPYANLKEIFQFDELSVRRRMMGVSFVDGVLGGGVDGSLLLERFKFKVPDTRLRKRQDEGILSPSFARTLDHYYSPLNTLVRWFNEDRTDRPADE